MLETLWNRRDLQAGWIHEISMSEQNLSGGYCYPPLEE